MNLIKHCLNRIIILYLIIGNPNFLKAQSETKSISYHFIENQEINKSLREALSDVGRKYNVSFVYLDKIVDNKVVRDNSYNKNGSLDKDLSDLLKDFHLWYRKISDKQIAIIENTSQKAEKKKMMQAVALKYTSTK